jgi:hypothetical protein
VHLDLHRHLEGSHSPAALLEVARQFDVRNPVFFDERAGRFRSEAELAGEVSMTAPSADARVFYDCIVKARAAYVSVPAIAALAVRAFREAAADSDGFEMRLSLFSMTRTLIEQQGRAWREVPPLEFAERWARPILVAVLAARDEVHAATRVPMVVRLVGTNEEEGRRILAQAHMGTAATLAEAAQKAVAAAAGTTIDNHSLNA